MIIDRFHLASSDAADPAALRGDEPDWIPAAVPGGVHESLLAADRIPHPYRDTAETAVAWVEDATWWYRTEFDGPADEAADERLRLVCPALDTVAAIWLNGELVGTHESQFRPAVLDVTGRLQDRNELLIRFAPPLEGLTAPPGVTDTVARMKELFAAAAPDQLPDPDGPPPPGVMSANRRAAA